MKIIHSTHTGGVAITDMSPGVEHAGLAEGQWRELTADEVLPPPELFRAWTFGPVIGVDTAIAHEVQRFRWRERRGPLLARLDVAVNRAADAGNAEREAALRAARQALRDVTGTPVVARDATVLDEWPPVFAETEALLA